MPAHRDLTEPADIHFEASSIVSHLTSARIWIQIYHTSSVNKQV